MRRCDKCGRPLPAGCYYFEMRIKLAQGFDGVIADEQQQDLKTLMAQLEQQTAGMPESLLEQEVHREFSFVLCPRCKEKFSANPLDLPLDARQIPKKVSDLEES
jgi:hypothetical protein